MADSSSSSSPVGPPGSHLFSQLRQPIDPAELKARQENVAKRMQEHAQKAYERQVDLVRLTSTQPVHITSVRLLGATNTRDSFLQPLFRPLLSHNEPDAPVYTLKQALTDVNSVVDKLNRLDIFQLPIETFIDRPDKSDPSTSPTDHTVYITAKERGRYTIKTGTEAGTLEGSAYVNAVLRNLFGGAESLTANASFGTRTRSAYNATFATPILSNPDLLWDIGGVASTTTKPWASHDEVLRGGSTRLLWRTSPGHSHQLAYNGFWRQVTSLAEKASPTVREDAGDTFKSSLTHTWTNDTRDIPMLPSRGYLFKTISELAGFGPLKGDVAFAKFELDSQAAVPVAIPGLKSASESGISITASLRGGLLYPLSTATAEPYSRINDRFQLGGPTDVRGFRLGGLGPRDGQDSVGGDVFYAAGASLLLPLPRVSIDTPLRLQAFVNSGRLVALNDYSRSGQGNPSTQKMLASTVDELANGLPSTAAGFGLVYAHPAARFEVNFSLPLITRRGEEGRKGVSFGVGVSFM